MRFFTKEKSRGILLLWFIAALFFAVTRIPYDDEWFSITLARDTDWKHFWWSLNHDIHPPWVALFDQSLIALFGIREVLPLPRLIVSLIAIRLLTRVVSLRTEIPEWVVALAAFHPIIFMYSGAARWYPFLFLAQSMRAWALWGPRPFSPLALTVFVVGAVLGPAAGYVDHALVLLDAGWLVWMAHKAGMARRVWGVLLTAGGGIAGLILFSPLPSHLLKLLVQRNQIGSSFFPHFLNWGVLGIVGEAHPPFPFWAFSVFVLIAMLGGMVLLIRNHAFAPFNLWVLTVGITWAGCTNFGVGHPRYSLMWWFMLATSMGLLWQTGKNCRRLVVVSLIYGGVVFGYMIHSSGFIKGDLNLLPRTACQDLLFHHLPKAHPTVIIAPYPKTSEMIRLLCRPNASVVTAPWIRHFPKEQEQMASIEKAIEKTEELLVITTPTNGSSMEVTFRRVQNIVATRCVKKDEISLVEDPHYTIKSLFRSEYCPISLFF